MTLMAVSTSDGCVGRRDARCYNAHSPDCGCICGGANHGAGLARTVDNTRETFEQWIGAYAKEKHLTDYRAEVPDEVIQTRMF